MHKDCKCYMSWLLHRRIYLRLKLPRKRKNVGRNSSFFISYDTTETKWNVFPAKASRKFEIAEKGRKP